MPASDQGVEKQRYALIPRTLIFLTTIDHVLLLKGAAHKRLWADLYNGIGGHVEKGEDVLSAAHRELLEESTLRVENLWLCGIVTINTGQDKGVVIFIFRGDYDSIHNTENQQEWKTRDSLEGTLEWVPLSELLSLPLVEDLPIILPRVLAAQKGAPPFFARYSYDDLDQLVISFSEFN